MKRVFGTGWNRRARRQWAANSDDLERRIEATEGEESVIAVALGDEPETGLTADYDETGAPF